METTQNNPILNSPYEIPNLYYRTQLDGTLDYNKILKGRRKYDPKVNAPIPVKSSPQSTLFSSELLEEADNHLINLLRREVGKWREESYPNASRVTRELLLFWFENPNRLYIKKLFFAQRVSS